MPGALDGIKVLEFSQLIAGPVTGLNLADLGAEVVKVEPPTGDTARAIGAFLPHESKLFHALNRGKRSVVIDAHTPPGRDLIHRLIPSFDVFLINARPGAALRLGMDYGALRPLRPDLIYLENTGFGEAGPAPAGPRRTCSPRPTAASSWASARSTTPALRPQLRTRPRWTTRRG